MLARLNRWLCRIRFPGYCLGHAESRIDGDCILIGFRCIVCGQLKHEEVARNLSAAPPEADNE